MRRLRFLILVLFVVGALSQLATLRAQDSPEEPGGGDIKVYLPAILQGGAGHTHDENELAAQLVVRVIYRSPEEMEYFLSSLDVLEASCGPQCIGALVTPAHYQQLVAEGRQVTVDEAQTAQLADGIAQVPLKVYRLTR